MTFIKINGKIYQKDISERDEKMLVQNEKEEKKCCFYVSDYHLEMILVPYINEKIEENITILSEKKLKDTLEVLISKMNLNEENKQRILKLGWNGEEEVKDNSNIIIIGSKEYIENKNEEILNQNTISVLDCYSFEEEKENINNIVRRYNSALNTMGGSDF